MHIGTAYYPEHVTSNRVEADARLMQEAGVNLVRMGEFAWVMFDCDWAFSADMSNPNHRYQRHLLKYSQALFRNQVSLDVVSPTDDWSQYRLLVAPSLVLVNDALVEKLADFARRGGTLVLTCLSGLRDMESVFIPETFPGKLRELTGVEIEEQDTLPRREPIGIRLLEGGYSRAEYDCSIWADVFKPTTAKVLANYNEKRRYSGSPAITVNAYGAGRVFYLGTLPEDEFLKDFMQCLADECGISRPVISDSPMVEVVHTRKADETIIFVLNFSQEPQTVTAQCVFTNLANGQPVSGVFTIEPLDVVVLKASGSIN
jgi:beta-galactosidase